MKRWLKYGLIAAVCLLGLVGVVVGVLMVPNVQRTVVQSVAARYLDVASVESLEVDGSGVRFTKGKFSQGPIIAELEAAELDILWVETMTQGRLVVDTLNLKGVRLESLPSVPVEQTEPQPEEATAPPDLTTLLGSLGLAQWMTIGRGEIDLELVSPEAGLVLSLRVRDWEPASRGQVNADWEFRPPIEQTDGLKDLKGSLEMSLDLDGKGLFAAGEGSGSVSAVGAEGQGVAASFELDLSTLLSEGAVGVTLDTASTASDTVFRLFSGKASLPPGQSMVRFAGDAAVDTSELAPVLAAFDQDFSVLETSAAVEGVYDLTDGMFSLEAAGNLSTADLDSQFLVKVDTLATQPMSHRVTGSSRNLLKATNERVNIERMDLRIAGQGIEGDARVTVIDASRRDHAVDLSVAAPAETSAPIQLHAQARSIYPKPLVQAIGGLISAIPSSPTESAPAPQAELSGAWFARPFEITADVERLEFSPTLGLDRVSAKIFGSGDQLRLEQGKFDYLGSLVTQVATIDKGEQGFALTGVANVEGLELAKVLRSFGTASVGDAIFRGDLRFESQASELGLLGDNLALDWNLLARDGKVEVPSDGMLGAVRDGTRLASGISALLPGQTYLGDFERILQRAEEIGFETLVIEGARSSDGMVQLEQAELRGNEFYARLKGQINSSDWTNLMQSAMRMQLTLGAKGEVAEWAERIGMSEGRMRDDYALWSKLPFSIEGTLEDPNFDALRRWALSLVGGKATRFIQGLAPENAEEADPDSPVNAVRPVLDLLRGIGL